MKKKKTALIIVIVCLLVIIGAVLYFVLFRNRTVKVKSIEVPNEKVILEYGEKHKVQYTIKPENATNKEVKITSENGLLTNKKNAEEFVTVNNTVHGDDKICITSVEDESIKTCYEIHVNPQPFSERMQELGFTKNGYKYTNVHTDFTQELDVSQRYLKVTSKSGNVSLEYIYYYRAGYGESTQKSGGFTVEWLYRDDTNRATCAASSYYSTFCNYTSESNLINTFQTIKESVEVLISDYTDAELLT